MAHPTGFEPVTSAFGGQRSIHKPLKTLSFSQIYLIQKDTSENVAVSNLCQFRPQILKGCICLNRGTTQVSQTRRWVFSIDYTDGDRTAPKLDGVTKYFQQDEGRFYPHTIWPLCNRFHIVTVVSVEEELTWIWKTPVEWVNGISDYPPNFLNVDVVVLG